MDYMKNIIRPLKNLSEFNKSFAQLFSSSILIALIGAFCIPVISRIYSPEDLGLFQLFLSIVLVFSSIASFKYELALVLPKRLYQVRIVFYLSLVVLIITTALYSAAFVFLSKEILSYFNAESLERFFWVIPIGIFFSGLAQVMQMYLVSNGDFGNLSVNKAVQSLSNNLGSIGLGSIGPSFSALIVSYVSSLLLALLLMMLRFKHNWKGRIKHGLLIRYAKKYRKFPTVNSVNVFLNTMSMNCLLYTSPSPRD